MYLATWYNYKLNQTLEISSLSLCHPCFLWPFHSTPADAVQGVLLCWQVQKQVEQVENVTLLSPPPSVSLFDSPGQLLIHCYALAGQ